MNYLAEWNDIYDCVRTLYRERYGPQAWESLVDAGETSTDVLLVAIKILSQCNE